MYCNSAYRGIYGLLARQAEVVPSKPALIVDGESVSFGTLNDLALKVAGALHEMGVTKGDSVGLLMPTSINWIAIYFGIQALGAICVPLNPEESKANISHILELSAIKVCFTIRRFDEREFEVFFRELNPSLPNLKRVVVEGASCEDEFIMDLHNIMDFPTRWRDEMTPDLADDDLHTLLPTLGTEGLPKLVPKAHASNISILAAYILEYPVSPLDVVLTAIPPYQQLSLSFLLMCMIQGATMEYLSVFDPATMLEAIEKSDATMVLLFATHARLTTADPHFADANLSSVNTFIFSGDFLSDEVANQFYRKRSFRVLNIIGSTEVGAYLVWDSRRDSNVSVSVLAPLDYAEIALMKTNGEPCEVNEQAEIIVSHSDVLSGYYKNHAATQNSFLTGDSGQNWFKTGDLAILRSDGRYQFTGRVTPVSGENISD